LRRAGEGRSNDFFTAGESELPAKSVFVATAATFADEQHLRQEQSSVITPTQ